MMLSERVRPKQIAALIGNEQSRLEIIQWLKGWKVGSKALLLVGPPGVGKSTSVYTAASELGYSVVVYNASDVRTKSKLSNSLGGALQNSSLFGQDEKLLIFLDEVDGISGRADYAGIDFILEFMENASMPVVMAANVEDDPKIRKLEQKSKLVRFTPVNEDLIFIYLKSTAKRQNISVSDESLGQIATSCRGDVRYALNLLQTALGETTRSQLTDKQFFNDSSAIDAILNSGSFEEAISRLKQFGSSPFEKLRRIFDSVVVSKSLDETTRAKALGMVAVADLLLQQISRNQQWRLLRYMDRFLALAVNGRKIRRSDSSIPWNLRISIWNDGRLTRGFLSDLPTHFHVGKSAFAVYYLPYLAFYLKNRPSKLRRFLECYEYGDSEKRVLLKLASKSGLRDKK